MNVDTTAARRPSSWPWVFVAAFLVVAFVGQWLAVQGGASWRDDAVFIALFFGYGLVGALITSRMPGNRVGLLLMYVSGVSALSFLAEQYRFVRIDDGWNGSLEGWLALMGEAAWILALMPGLLFLLQLFPDGRPVGRGGRWLAGITLAFTGFSLLAVVASPAFGSDPHSANPIHWPALEPIGSLTEAIIFPGFLILLVASLVSVVLRFRRSTGQERQQLRWMAFAAPVMVVGFVLAQSLTDRGVSSFFTDLIVAVSLGALPAAIGVAILRYRLWDLDVVVRKALLAAFLVVILMAAFGLLSFVAQAALDVGGDGDVVVAALVGFAVWPAYRLARRLADRVVYGGRATPYEVLAGFADRVGATYAGDDVLQRLVTAVGEGIGAERADLWIDRAGGPVLAATWPPDVPEDQVVGAADERSAAFPIEFNGDPLGRLGARKAPGERMSGTDHKLIANLAAQSGPLLHNVSLTEELKERLADLQGARRRLVTAQDEERRRLERNIHDGAQQQLVALAVKLRLADQLIDRDAAKAHEALAGLQTDATTALEDLRDLARGVYPPLLADKGLAVALDAQARRSPVPVTVRAEEDLGRFPAEVEAAVYFSSLEAMQNVAKYADAAQVEVEISRINGDLRFSVRDDGRGFDASAASYGTGLQGIADRLAALDGELDVDSEPGHGTTVVGRIPIGG